MTILCLTSGEVTGILNSQPSGSNQSGPQCLCSADSHQISYPSNLGRSLLSFCRTTQRYASDCCLSLQEELGLCFITGYCLSYHLFSCWTAFPLFLSSLTSLISNCLRSFGFPGRQRICLPVQETQRHEFHSWVRKIPWRRKWQPTLEFLHGAIPCTEESDGIHPWSGKESDTTEQTDKSTLWS